MKSALFFLCSSPLCICSAGSDKNKKEYSSLAWCWWKHVLMWPFLFLFVFLRVQSWCKMESFEQLSSMCRHPLERPAAGVWFGKKCQLAFKIIYFYMMRTYLFIFTRFTWYVCKKRQQMNFSHEFMRVQNRYVFEAAKCKVVTVSARAIRSVLLKWTQNDPLIWRYRAIFGTLSCIIISMKTKHETLFLFTIRL